ncbi:ferredoxin--NADP reductase [Gordonia sp. TBRC 11910]|uniref:Ferredoxin--NADP reductase n=1 Tax=Gordonia asplenii TaxID=2725283 RepID=A0A848KX78_9ACTN|nr:ferredoxin--NADP reductase [Gordonia asplenii]NMO02929.1 ferredoxin--NADP reductase [Gordonia asplenii]
MSPADPPTASRGVLLDVSNVIAETADACSVEFDVPAADRHRFSYAPGQFLTLRVPSDQTGSVARCYSLASSPITDSQPKITVKRTNGGYASNWICDHVRIGDRIEALVPAGAFTPTDLDEDVLLIAGGSGITPVMSILKSVLARGTAHVTLLYANRDGESIIFQRELRELQAEHSARLTAVHWLESVQGRPSATQLTGLLAPYVDRRSFVCGPAPFMAAVRAALTALSVPRNRIHVEAFNSLTGDPFTSAATVDDEGDESGAQVTVHLDGQTHQLRWPQHRSLVDIMLANGIDVPYSCNEGECGSCFCRVRAGSVTMDTSAALDAEELADGYILGCQAHPDSDSLTIEF